VLGWEELELEVVRDAKNQMITVCFIENVDAMGVHTGDSYCTAPMLTISPELQQRLQKHSYDIVEAIQVIGGTNIQFAHDPKTDRVVVIELNVGEDDMGRVIGKQGRIAKAIRAVVKSAAANEKKRYLVEIVD